MSPLKTTPADRIGISNIVDLKPRDRNRATKVKVLIEERRKTVVSAVGEDQGGNSMPCPIGLISLIASVGVRMKMDHHHLFSE
ncbi:hypothetical protein Tco_1000837 [Tanacetum coccineum]